MDRILSKITEKIETNHELFVRAGVEPPAVIDFYAGQIEQPDQFEFVTPAVFLDYSADYNNGMLYIYLHAVYDFTPDTENIAATGMESFRHIHFYSLLKRLLKGVKCKPAFGALQLYQDEPETTDYAHCHRITFVCSLFDDLDDRYGNYIDVEPVALLLERGKIAPKE